MPDPSKPNRRTIVASALLAAGVIGTAVDPSGPVGITLFGVAVAAAVYLVARPARKVVRRLATSSRPRTLGHWTVSCVVVRWQWS
jgi:hypothetical protein